MNYYPFHVGDYAAHTAHLEPMEDLAYRRMLDAYYLREEPLPAEPADVARLIRMRQNMAEVEAVLREFFSLTPAGWSHIRCDEEIERMKEKQEANEVRDSHEKDRMKRHRERRAEMFQALRDVGVIPPWDVSMKELQRLHDENCNAPETHLKREQAISGTSPATAIPTPTPTPTPTPKEKPVGAASRPQQRGARLPVDWSLPTEWAEWALSERPGYPVILEASKFRDYWVAKTGADATKADWQATWRNWVRNTKLPAQKPGRHTGFDRIDYSEGVTADGRF